MSSNNTQLKYSKIIEEIKNDILSGKIKVGDKITSENKLCEQHKVSRHTVRKAISDLVNKGYLTSIHGKGTYYTKNIHSEAPSHNIGVITTYISDYIFPHVIKGIDHVLSKNGYSIILKNTGNSQRMEEKCLEDMLNKNIDGIIIEPSKSDVLNRNIYLYEKLDEYNIPYVFIHGLYQHFSDKPYVLLDEIQGSYNATKHLLDIGKKNLIGIFKIDDYQGKERHKGYTKALREAGIPYDPDRIIMFHTEDRKTKPSLMIREFINNKTPIDGILCYNDQIAHSVYQELISLGINVPEQIAIVGYDNSFIAENNRVPLTSVNHPKEELGKMAAKLLLDIIHAKADKDQLQKIIAPELILRESTKL
ncbi:GntR family transcriptional regulator [Mobilitalea sibirica]|uniref:GntR family transcriptional regulator n=1 Tax=Mobilitalea sibirica TaxID=1462919 RepID=A0A8J7HBC4_9FIRM|nr:GntR family transcriptional regulator [Mobilitalea sibirica]MBH1940931.1 GntR family transcriptional regulator [Mobilitalea sibirica]